MILSRPSKRRMNWFNLCYIVIMFSLSTAGTALNWRWCEILFVEEANYPGGPYAFSNENLGKERIALAGNVVYIIAMWFSDALLLYRFSIIWNHNKLMMIVPALTFLATVIVGCLLIVNIVQPANNPYFGDSAHLTMVTFTLSAFFNACTTLAISGRLLYYRSTLKGMKAAASLNNYVSISAMLIESAALFTVTDVFLVVALGLNNVLDGVLMPLLGQIVIISPLMIVYRVQLGTAFSSETYYNSIHLTERGAPKGLEFYPHMPADTIRSSVTEVDGRRVYLETL
ncbi:hypothetical protein CONPUDRAFT_57557 [Coniophora puteana RWD-64-598 SS2]|uniref:Integral membrane protein n=1 Tax=Coniophora puteana (strain RWD-64-598) TaxID=741705 RepID=A0A5M3MNC2_CONPW|nr:uncharacterized protein CONPUDRAFT_57557 [Coniophora puteana RWD-64-598 SS2]EIW80649.1 hypothetical protein CONPUDRAFT_57557 [Coniophora puteana RWD-64-598 SS2]